MAVENKYINADIVASKAPNTARNFGALTWKMTATFEVAAADSDLSVFRIIKNIPWNYTITDINVWNDAITAGTDYDIGLYEGTTDDVVGPVIDRELLAATLDLSTAHDRPSGDTPLNGLNAVAIVDIEKPLYLLAGETLDNHKPSYDVAITAVTVGSAAGTISVEVSGLQH